MRIILSAFLAAVSAITMSAAMAQTPEMVGRNLAEYLDTLNRQGLRVLYSGDLVSDDLRITVAPVAGDTRQRLVEILRPHGLTVGDGPAGSLLVVRLEDDVAAPVAQTPDAPTPTPPRIDEIVVTSSLHRLGGLHTARHTYLDRELATRIPAVGEEVVRLTQRLPGTASGGVSARGHIRGGEANEVLFLLDGVRLYEPFHLKDFQSVATIVNSNAVAGIDYYTGGYPARYGDRMSGVVNLSLREPQRDSETELGLSFFNTSALSLGRFGDSDRGDWLVALRRGNLDLIYDVVDPDRGSPSYQDLFAHTGWQLDDRHHVSANVLASHDKIALADEDRGERADAKYDNRMLWLKWGAAWSEALRSETVVSYTAITNRRQGRIDLPGVVTGSLSDERDFSVLEFRQDWQFIPVSRWMITAGVTARESDADYRYQSTRTVLPPFDGILDNSAQTDRLIDVSPHGAQYVAHASLRLRATSSITMDLGLRWDQQTYTTADNDTQVSPRVSLLYQPGERTEFRLGWGRFHQAQEINELQVVDGSTGFFAAQRAEHLVFDIEHSLRSGISLDLSLYRKKFRALRPRYENVFDSLTLIPELGIDRVRIDAGAAEARGAELLVSRGAGDESLFWWFGYAWSEVRDQTLAGRVKRSWDQTHTVNFGIGRNWGPWNFSAAGQVHTGWPKTEMRALAGPGGGPSFVLETTDRNSRRYSVFHTLDFRLSRDVALSRGELTLSLDVTNVYDRRNPCCTEYFVVPGASGAAALGASESNWLPLVPSLGVMWRF
jgi:hypothetical protein